MKLKIFILILVICFLKTAYSQYWPFLSYSSDNFSSAFGPRLDGSGVYDFHEAIDIAASENTPVYAVCSGTIKVIQNSDAPNNYIKVLHTDNLGDFYVLYMHCDPHPLWSIEEPVDETSLLGYVDYPSGSHLDIRYSESGPTDYINPGRMLDGTNYTSALELRDKYETVLVDGAELPMDVVENTYKYSLKLGAFAQDDALHMDEIWIYMTQSYYDDNDGVWKYYNESTLLDNSSNYTNKIKYEERLFCGSDDPTHSSSVTIDPVSFSSSGHDYQKVWFKWNFDEDRMEEIVGTEDIYIDVFMYSWGDICSTEVYNLTYPTCINCNPPSEAPDPPILTSAQYIPNSNLIKLNWEGYSSDFFKIYRCPAGQTMSIEKKVNRV